MTQDIKVTSKTLMQVKEIVDFIYEATVTESGYIGGWSKYSSRFRHVAKILVKRGILIREGANIHQSYKWSNAAMAPTKPLYKSVAQEMVSEERTVVKNSYDRKKRRDAERRAAEQKAQKVAEAASVLSEGEEPIQAPEVSPTAKTEGRNKPCPLAAVLAYFSDQALWDELKRRGARIVDGKMKVVREVELS